MDKMKILFVDDDIALGNVVMLALNSLGYDTYYQTSLTAIQSVIKELRPNMVILDVEIGEKNGIDATAELKRIIPDVPILFVSSHTDSMHVVKALNAGGIAYLKKPFDIEELVAYIERHTSSSPIAEIPVGSFTFNTQDHHLTRGDENTKKLSLFESKLLQLLVSKLNHTVNRVEIEQALWEKGYANEQSLNNYIAKLRKFLSEDDTLELITIPKIGYRLTQKG